MLPSTLLPNSESGTFLNSLETGASPVSTGDSGATLDTAFATILGSSGPVVPPATLLAGARLPGGGNPLPLLPAAQGFAAAPDPDEIVASLEEQIARILPGSNIPAAGSVMEADIESEPLIDDLADTRINPALDLPGLDNAEPVDEQAPATRAPPNTAVVDLPEVDTIPVPARPAPGVSLAPPPVFRDSGERVPPPPVADREQAPRLRGVVPAASPVTHQPAADAATPAVTPAPTAATGEPLYSIIDNKFTSIQSNPAPAATLTTDVSIESLNQPRLAVAETAAAGATRQTVPPSALPPIELAVQDPAWDRAVSERVVMMTANRVQTAEIRLTPAELGPLRVQVTLDDGAAHVTFTAQHAVTRDALEQALPRLRDMFTDTGIQLGDARVDVDNADTHQQQAERGGTPISDGHEPRDTGPEQDHDALVPVRQRRGLVDTFV